MKEIKMDEFHVKANTIVFKLEKTEALQNIEDEQVIYTEHKTQENIVGAPVKENNLEGVLCNLKLSSRYYIQFLSLISFLIIIDAGSSTHYIFSVEDITYRCKYSICTYPELLNLEKNSTFDYKCHNYELYDNNGTCTEDNFDVSNFTDCSEWAYDKPKSFVAEFNLGCTDWKRTLVGTMHSIGVMIGLLLTGTLSDKFGRKNMIIFSTLFSGVIGISKSAVKSYWLFIVFETFQPVLGDIYSTAYTIVAEMMTTKNRPITVLVFALSDSLGLMMTAILAYYSPNWRTFLIYLYSPLFIVIVHIFCLDESVRWLLIKGRKADAEKIIRNAAKTNKIVIDESKFVHLVCEEQSSIHLLKALNVTFSSKKILIRLLFCFFIWFTAIFSAYALLINSVSLEGSKYINFGLLSLPSAASGIILLFVLTKFKRKGPLIFALILTGAFCILQSSVPKGYRWLSISLYMCSKLTASITIKMAYLYTSELFPTYTRNSMVALCSSFGRIGSILAPQTPLLLVYWSSLPSVLVGILTLVTAIIVTLIPDTSENVLPDNVTQAETIGSKHNKEQL